jgi:hypothetical protein
MAEIILTFSEALTVDGVPCRARVCGQPAQTIWEGWIEFSATMACSSARRETTQPDRRALEYWASGLSPTYLEGAFARAERAARDDDIDADVYEAPEPARRMFDGPPVAEGAVLDPFSVGAKSEDVLRRELSALSDWHLRNIIREYDLAEAGADLQMLSQIELVELIVDAVAPA